MEDSQRRVGLIYDERMCKHFTPNSEDVCVVLNAKAAEDKYIAAVHTKDHIDLIKNISSEILNSQRDRVAATFDSIYFSEGSSEAAYLAAGSVIEVAAKVASGELNSAVAIVRPPGHHAEEHEPMRFCLYNNVAITASFLLNERPELGINKILIVDWDVHHGNGTQKMFWKDRRVLFFSVHKNEFASFYPDSDDGSHTMVGEGPGVGYNINVPWQNVMYGDADYLAVWDHILIPVAKEFSPDMIIISAGFGEAIGDPLVGCGVTPYGYSLLLRKLMEFAQGKVVMALEGGYNLDILADSILACVETLLDDKPIVGLAETYPFESTWSTIQVVCEGLSRFWPILADELSKKLRLARILNFDLDDKNIDASYLKGTQNVRECLLEHQLCESSNDRATAVSPRWRSNFSKVEVWYASYGSNMSKSRFLCYIKGGKVKDMLKSCSGSKDTTPPKDILWMTVTHRLFFGRERTLTWGPGGVAFLHLDSNNQDKAYVCLYKITLDQFNDVLCQENGSSYDMSSPLFSLTDLNSITNKKYISVGKLKRSNWYRTILYLGKAKNIPILTLTCSPSHIEGFKSNKFPLCPPGKGYRNTLVRGLVKGKQLKKKEAIAYIKESSTKPL